MYKPIFLLVVFILLLVSCASPGNSSVMTVSTPQPTRAVTLTPTPIPPEPALSPAPQHCPVSIPTLQSISPNLAPVIGASPIWATWPPDPSIFHGQPPGSNSSTYLPSFGWAMTKVVWEVGPNYTHLVSIQGHELFDHTPLLVQFLDNTPTADAVLDPQHPDHPVSVIGDGWAEWGSYIVAPKAGCYIMEVSWPTGRWTITFAFGA